MQLKYAAIALACLADQVYNAEAKVFIGSGVEGRMRRNEQMEVDYRSLHRRFAEPQAPSPASASVSSSPTSASTLAASSAPPLADMTAACMKSLSSLNGVATSPTGMSVCYDVDSLDTNTGTFVSNVLLYQVSPATGNWTVIDNQSLNVDIGYSGANMTVMGVAQRDTGSRLVARVTNTPIDAPVLLGSKKLQGQVLVGWNSNNETAQMMSLSPNVIVTAKTLDGKLLNATLPKTEAAFVTGFFTKTAAVNAAAASASAANTPFVLPGVAPAFFPVGAIVVGAWVLLFTLTVGLGTFGRLQFRQDYRARAGRMPYRPIGQPTVRVAAYDQR